MVAEISLITYLLPIFSFLLVFIVLYAILQKTHVLEENIGISIFISLILASFFIVETQLVDFVSFTASWFTVLIIVVFLLFLMLAFFPGEKPLEFLTKGNWFSFVALGLLIVFFIISATHVFNWTLNGAMLRAWAQTEWFGFILLAIIATVVSIVLAKTSK